MISNAARLANVTVALLFLSTLMPIWAALTPGPPPLAPKIIDGVLALSLIGMLPLLYRTRQTVTTEDRAKSYKVCTWLAVVPLLLFAIYFLGARLKWEVLLIGLGWRSWYLVTVLPFLFATHGRGS